MNSQEHIQEITTADMVKIRGGDYVARGLGLAWGLAFGAGLVITSPVSGPMLGAAVIAGAALLAYDSFVS